MHNAVHGFLALALQRTDGLQLLTEKLERKKFDAWQRDDIEAALAVDVRVDQFLSLYAKAKDPQRMGQYTTSRVLAPTQQQDASVARLNRLRNEFSHYSDISLSVAVAELPGVVADCLDVIEFLVKLSGNVMLYPFELSEQVEAFMDRIRHRIFDLNARFQVEPAIS